MTGLRTDLYELTMAVAYLRRGMTAPATFSLFVRELPPNRGFLIAAGLEDGLAALEGFRFDEEELAYAGEGLGFDREAVEALRSVRFTGDVWAVPEGTVVFAGEPLLEVTAPIAEGQLVETILLNQLTYQTALATKAARCVMAARGRDVVDFAFRRTHGVEAAMAVARTTAIAGFAATSNVEAARRFGLRAAGTMAHSFVEAFPSEAEAFRAFAREFPDRTTFLVDTYDTMGGVRAAVEVIHELGLSEGLAVRLDSGDLARLSREVRALLDGEGLPQVRIFASGGLDEFAIDDLFAVGAPIDGFGVGTRVGVSADAPFLDTAYKLVEFDGRPVMKLSTGKATTPGPKQVFRRPSFAGDVLALREEHLEGATPLLERVMDRGRRIGGPTGEGLAAIRERVRAALSSLPETARSIRSPAPISVSTSPGLTRLIARATQELRSGGPEREEPGHSDPPSADAG
jgi:nicotinate phosphoribosyltransferase